MFFLLCYAVSCSELFYRTELQVLSLDFFKGVCVWIALSSLLLTLINPKSSARFENS